MKNEEPACRQAGEKCESSQKRAAFFNLKSSDFYTIINSINQASMRGKGYDVVLPLVVSLFSVLWYPRD